MRNVLLLICLFVLPGLTWAAEDPQSPPAAEPVIQPPLERRNIRIPRIDTEDFEIGGFAGIYGAEDFGSNFVMGVQLDYHITEDFFLDISFGQTTVTDRAFRINTIIPFPNEEEQLQYYSLSLGYNFLPGEIFLGRGWAFTSSMYIIGGMGNTNLINEDRYTINVGFGARILITDWLAFHMDTRNHLFESDILGEKKLTNNLTLQSGITIFF